MSVTRLKRKHRKNIARANNETKKIKDLLRTPVLKNVDLEELKSRFGQTASAETEKKNSQPSVDAAPAAEAPKTEGLLDKVAHAASAAADAVKHAAADAVDAVTHSAAFEAAQNAAHNVVEGAKHVLGSQEQAAADEPAKNEEAQVNQTGTEGFDEAEAVTKPVNSDGQAGEHPKPEIQL
jgi:hypothetical protein